MDKMYTTKKLTIEGGGSCLDMKAGNVTFLQQIPAPHYAGHTIYSAINAKFSSFRFAREGIFAYIIIKHKIAFLLNNGF